MVDQISNRIRRLNATYYPKHVFMSPKWLVLGVNNTCNLHCKMCDVGVNYTESNFYQNLMGSKPLHMPIDLFKEITDQAAISFPHVKLGYAFTEPLIYTHLEESLAYAKAKSLYTSLTTNGLGLKKWSTALDRQGLRELNLSLDGPEDIHNFIRGNPHSFSKAMEGIESLISMESKIKINVFCVITEWNADRLVEFLNKMNSYPFNKVGLMHSNFTPQQIADGHNEIFGGLYPATASNTSDTKLSTMNLNFLWEEMDKIKKHNWNFPVEFFPEISSMEKLRKYYQNPELFMGKRCMDVFSNMMIKSNGDVIPAHGRCYNLVIGNLYKQNLNQIWNSEIVSVFREKLVDSGGLLPACSRCCSSFIG